MEHELTRGRSGRDLAVLVFSHSGELSGAELALADLAAVISGQGIRLTVAVPSPGPLRERLEALGVPVVVAPVGTWASYARPGWRRGARDLLSLAGQVRRARHLIRHLQPDLVCTNSVVPITAALAARREGVRHAWFVHELLFRADPLTTRVPRRLMQWAIKRLASVVIVPSRCVADEHPSATVAICPPVCLPSPAAVGLAADAAELTMALVGYLVPVKRGGDAIKGLAELRQRGVPAHLVLVGGCEPAERPRLVELARSLGVDAQVQWFGFTEDPWSAIPRNAILVSCSVSESFGRVVVEAMRAGVPVVAARSAASPELVEHGVTGLMFDAFDTTSLADQVQRLHVDPELRRQLSERARSFASGELDPGRCAERIESAWRSVVREPP